MYLLRIEHPVPNFEDWKATFDRDPINRAASEVTAFRISRPVDDDRYILVDLELPTQALAEDVQAKLQALWSQASIVAGLTPKTRILQVSKDGTP